MNNQMGIFFCELALHQIHKQNLYLASWLGLKENYDLDIILFFQALISSTYCQSCYAILSYT